MNQLKITRKALEVVADENTIIPTAAEEMLEEIEEMYQEEDQINVTIQQLTLSEVRPETYLANI